jgi:hypothetical protein
VAPFNMRQRFYEMIDREMRHVREGCPGADPGEDQLDRGPGDVTGEAVRRERRRA